MLKMMKKSIRISAIVLGLGGALSSGAAIAGNIIVADGSGWINSGGGANSSGFNSGLNNTFSGWTAGAEYNNYISFTLPTSNISNATLYIWNEGPNPSPNAYDPLATYNLHAATGFSFFGLESGSILGTVLLADANTGDGYYGRYVGVTLNSIGVAALNQAGGHQFSFGGSVDTSYPNPINTVDKLAIFGSGTGRPAAYLDVLTAVPEPETYAMLLAGLGLMGGIVRRRKQK